MASGDLLVNADIATRVNTLKLTSDSAAITTETSIGSLVCFLEAGKTYSIVVSGKVSTSSVASPSGESNVVRVREDTAAGTQISAGQVYMPTTSTVGFTITTYTEYTAVSTGNKTFHLTINRNGGAGNHVARAAAGTPFWMLVNLLPD